MLTDKDVSNFRARRLYTVRACDDLLKIVDNIGVEDGSVGVESRFRRPPLSDAVRTELRNQVILVMRTILAHNDGGCQPVELQRY